MGIVQRYKFLNVGACDGDVVKSLLGAALREMGVFRLTRKPFLSCHRAQSRQVLWSVGDRAEVGCTYEGEGGLDDG